MQPKENQATHQPHDPLQQLTRTVTAHRADGITASGHPAGLNPGKEQKL